MEMRKVRISGLVLLAILISGWASGCTAVKEPTPTPGAQTGFTPVVSVTGELVPARWATLSHPTGGIVAQVLVEPGDPVAAGALLMRLGPNELEIAQQLAQREVAAQQAALDQLLQGASEQLIARTDREHAQQVAQAQVALKVKQQQLEQARTLDVQGDVAAAQARLRQIELQLSEARAQDQQPDVTVAQVELERAKIALDDAQNEYNKALDRPWEEQSIRDAWARQLKQAQLNYRLAQSHLDRALSAQRAHVIGLDVMAAQWDEAGVRLQQAIEARDAYTATLSIMGEEVEAAQLELDHLQAWENPYRDKASDQQVAQARARLQQAELNLAQAERQLQDAEIHAPFQGNVGAVYVRAGELVSLGQPLLALGDLTTLRMETTDLDEIDVARVSVGQGATLTFDALPDKSFAGRVVRISPMAGSGTGGVHYTAVIELEEIAPELRWGMTAFADIQVR
jgi:multidrug resistance efflux pump